MIELPAGLLIATAAFPFLGAVGTLFFSSHGQQTNGVTFPTKMLNHLPQVGSSRNPRLGYICAQFGLVGASASAAVLAILLALETKADAKVVRLPLVTWFQFSIPQSVSVAFGFEADVIKAGLISLIGIAASVSLWSLRSQSQMWSAVDVRLVTSLLVAMGTAFILAPNTAQALLGWAAVSALTAILVRLSHRSKQLSKQGLESGIQSMTSSSSKKMGEGTFLCMMERLGTLTSILERDVAGPIWYFVTSQFVDWIGEQTEVMDRQSISLLRVATMLWASAILLTWLLAL